MKRLSPHIVKQLIVTLVYLTTVFVYFVLAGWLLNGYGASRIIWLGTLALTAYLIWVGTGAVPIVSVWVVGLMSVVALRQLWFYDLPKPPFHFIPMVALGNWLISLGLVWLLATVSDFLRNKHIPRVWVFLILMSLVLAALAVGSELYSQTHIWFLNLLSS